MNKYFVLLAANNPVVFYVVKSVVDSVFHMFGTCIGH